MEISNALIRAVSSAIEATLCTISARTDSGSSSTTSLWKRSLEGLLTRYPRLFKVKRTELTNATRARTRLSRSLIWSRSCWVSSLPCTIGLSRLRSARPRRARTRASRSSLLRSLCEMVRVLRGLATTTSIPRESRNRLVQGECIPASMTTKAPGYALASFASSLRSLRIEPLFTTSPRVSSTQTCVSYRQDLGR